MFHGRVLPETVEALLFPPYFVEFCFGSECLVGVGISGLESEKKGRRRRGEGEEE
jgi:hypothetical protein